MRKSISIAFLVAAALAFFASTAWLGKPPDAPRPGAEVWNSPDEMANAFWSVRTAERLPLAVRDDAVGLGAGAVHPRSFAVYGDALVPGSFPGLFLLYGAIHFVFGAPLWMLTPLFTALAGLCFFALVRRLFDERTAFWSALLFYLHPAVIYYSGRGLFHNVLFVDLVIFGAVFFVFRPFKKTFGARERLDDALGGALLGYAIVTRASEAVWLIPAVAAFLPLVPRPERWRRAAMALCGAAVPIFIFLTVNSALYGSPFKTGYVAPPPAAVQETGGNAGAGTGASVSLPFGFHPRLILLHGLDYGLLLFWWFTALALIGAIVFLIHWRRAAPARKTAFIVLAAVAGWLTVVYGSWLVHDTYDPTKVTIGTSYVRYFLPAYVLMLPWSALGLIRLADRLGRTRRWIAPLLGAVVLMLSLRTAVTDGDESLLAVQATLRDNAVKKEILLGEIPPEAVVMTDRFDKVIFPERMRIVPLQDDASFAAIALLSKAFPALYYGLDLSDADLAALQAKAMARGLRLREIARPVPGETLYQFDRYE